MSWRDELYVVMHQRHPAVRHEMLQQWEEKFVRTSTAIWIVDRIIQTGLRAEDYMGYMKKSAIRRLGVEVADAFTIEARPIEYERETRYSARLEVLSNRPYPAKAEENSDD